MDTLSSLIQEPVFDALVALLYRSDHKLRKQLLSLSRYGQLPNHYGNLLNIVEDGAAAWLQEIDHVVRSGSRRDTLYPSILYRDEPHILLNDFLRNPLYQGAAIMAIFIYTPGDGEIAQIKLESYLKEINVLDGTNNAPNINFAPFFGDYNTPLHDDIPANPKMARRVHESIDSWIRQIGRYIHTPRMSKKLLTSNDRESIKEYLDHILHEPQYSTQADLELLEFEHHIQLDEPAELKQQWRTNGLAPRSYYVCGSGLYYDVRYTQRMWNDLVDSLAATHRRGRVNPGRIYIDNMKHALFYDLTSFTSNMALQPIFLDRLALYCQGSEIEVMSTVDGVVPLQLSDVIRAYNSSNSFPPYVCPALATMMSPTEDVHGVAGFLGVYGNIATCMFLHGAVLLQLAEREDEVGVAGDDAVIVVHYGEEQTVFAVVAILGILAREKTFDSDSDVVYLKRRVELGDHNRLLTHHYIQLPSFLFLLNSIELRRFRESSKKPYELRDIAISSLGAFFSSASLVDVEYHDRIRDFAGGYYRLLGLPENGYVPQFHYGPPVRRSRLPFVPSVSVIGSESYVTDTLRLCHPGFSMVSVRDELVGETDIDLVAGITFTAYTQPSLTFLIRLGYVERVTTKREMVLGDEGLERTIAEYTRSRSLDAKQYTFRIVKSVPPSLRGGDISIYGVMDFDFGKS